MEITPIFSLIVFLVAFVAGLLGSLTGLGGGVVLTPLLVLFLGVPVQDALGTSLISTIATSNGAASAFVRERLASVRIGISLQIGTITGAIVGSLTLYLLQKLGLLFVVNIILGSVLIFSAFPNFLRMGIEAPVNVRPDIYAEKLRLNGTFHDEARGVEVSYVARRYPFGLILMVVSGFLAGLLGIGSGALNVLAMDIMMALPFKVSTATSIFMIGVTSATSSGLYWSFGFIQPILIASAVPGVLIGALIGARLLNKIVTKKLRQLFILVLLILGAELILKGLGIII